MPSQPPHPEPVSSRAAWRERAAAVADPELPAATLPRELIAEIFAHARECYPEECCGLLIGMPDGGKQRVVRCANVQSQRQARGESELDASQGFWIDPSELEAALRAAQGREEELRAVYHSHVDTEAYLSQTDLLAATGSGGEPIWPGVAHLVISVREGKVRSAALFEWDDARSVFRGRFAHEEG